MTTKHENYSATACTCGWGLGEYEGTAEARYAVVVAGLLRGAK